jgi:hypothetical protein
MPSSPQLQHVINMLSRHFTVEPLQFRSVAMDDDRFRAAFHLVYNNYETVRLVLGSSLLAALTTILLFFDKDVVWNRYVDNYREKTNHYHWLIYNGPVLIGILSGHYDGKLLELSLAVAPEWRRLGLVRDFAPQVIRHLQTQFEECVIGFDSDEMHPYTAHIARYFSHEYDHHPVDITIGPVTVRRNYVLCTIKR